MHIVNSHRWRQKTNPSFCSQTELLLVLDGFGGLVVSMLASGTQGRGFKPSRSRWIFTDVKILSMPSSGGEVKESVPVPALQHVKEPSNLRELLIAS
jgi:hypothetical protein